MARSIPPPQRTALISSACNTACMTENTIHISTVMLVLQPWNLLLLLHLTLRGVLYAKLSESSSRTDGYDRVSGLSSSFTFLVLKSVL